MNAFFRIQRDALLGLQRLIVGGAAFYDVPPVHPCVYFANHTSHLDTTGLLAAIPPIMRDRTRPVAGADYWDKTALRRYIAHSLLNVVLVDRAKGGAEALVPLTEALDQQDSLIVFPEGTRKDATLPGEFKSGLYHLSRDRPTLALVPVYQQNLHRALPKGAPLPLPLLCRSHFGAPLYNDRGEDKETFLARMHQAVCDLADTF
ncbi:1-acyl-sn-glycerol-3-phosphate acyltransferase [Massilia violaceinigra]|uniref:1-acyl-sn-glycerol-3-phosphate acyltransferase n=1 Tax=Massilia violaceinigra TaxID=2045208 RepID=A0A2D2DLK6_9BURK|nr:lysophospholipid acyltransferase family protein [Massilia violaceinigra]ATQ75864.1 1-acyl-sn-glycerol-3-phosphate acyltransferase [Massilia violaceinigra]